MFLNGYQGNCELSSFQGTFATADQILQRDGRASLFFDNCSIANSPIANRPTIEELGTQFGVFLNGLRYDSGAPVLQVDVVAHSMGGLIVRSYLSGKRAEDGVFVPPADPKIRKAVFIATPHFGTSLTALLGSGTDRQTTQLQLGSPFVFDLATWNQGIDDLRGVDAISVLGDAGTGVVGIRGFDDTVTSLTSGSLGFALADRTRIVPYCHTGGFALLGCAGGARPIAQMDSADHLTAQIVGSFLADTDTWRTVGRSGEAHPLLSARSGLLVRSRDAVDRLLTPSSASVAGVALQINSQIVYSDYLLFTQPFSLSLVFASGSSTFTPTLIAGAMSAVTQKAGPSITSVYPSLAVVHPRSVAPGSLVSVYGSQFATTGGDLEVTAAGQRMPVSFANDTQINALLPENVSGLVKLRVRSAAGEHTVNVLVEPAVPAIFNVALNAVTGAIVSRQAPLHPGDYVALYATGLGRATPRDGLEWADVAPEVTIGGQPCAVTYAGRVPGIAGLDVINCRLSLTTPLSDSAQVVVRSGARFGNVTSQPVQ